MKAVLVFVAVVFIILFYPRYDLLVKNEFFDENFRVERTGFLTSKGCHQAAFDMRARYYTCRSRTLIQGLYEAAEIDESKSSTTESGLGTEI